MKINRITIIQWSSNPDYFHAFANAYMLGAQNILRFIDLTSIRHSLIGHIDSTSDKNRLKLFKNVTHLGEACL